MNVNINYRIILLYIVMFIHILNELFLSTYIFIFKKKYDIYYMIFVFIIILHWMFFKYECTLSYIEKKLINSDYKLGTLPFVHPYRSLLSIYILYTLKTLKTINIIVIVLRNLDNIFIIFTFILVIIFGIYNYIEKSKIKNNDS